MLCQGDTDTDAYLVLKGRVVVEQEEAAAPNDPVAAGRAVWRVSALAGTPRVATAIAEEASQVLRLPTGALRELMKPRAERSSARGWPSA